MTESNMLVISTSLNAGSKSRLLARAAHKHLSIHQKIDWIDLQEYPLPLCDGGAAYSNANVIEMGKRIKQAKCILVATPIYNYDVNAALKNLIELTGRAWEDKAVGFICAAGGRSSYMSVMAVASSLMLDFRTLVIPRFVYSDGEGFDGENLTPSIQTRIEELCDYASRLNKQLYQPVEA